MRIVYEPRGAAREYSPLAANLYSGCSHGCTYCYVPGCLKRTRQQFATVRPRDNMLRALERDAKDLHGDTRPVLLCFTCDPYQELERSVRLTRGAIEILAAAGLAIRVLTKNPSLALDLDSDVLVSGHVEFGTTVLFVDDLLRQAWEPNAPPVDSRIRGLQAAHDMGLRTWVSLEPVIDPGQALAVIRAMHKFVDVWKVGRWNHDARAKAIDWPGFTRHALELLAEIDARYYIKDELWRSAGAATAGWPKCNTGYIAQE